jgi:hypothetical protein
MRQLYTRLNNPRPGADLEFEARQRSLLLAESDCGSTPESPSLTSTRSLLPLVALVLDAR